MRRSLVSTMLCSSLVALGGSSMIGPSPEARKKAQYEEHGPKYTEDQKAAMSTEHKLALYNLNVEKRHQLKCRGERPTGTRFKVTRCFTFEEQREMRNAAQDFMRRARRGQGGF